MKLIKIPLLLRLVLAIFLGIILGNILNESIVRIFVTFSSLFSSFLSFLIPLVIIGFIIPGISDLSKNAGKLLGISALIAYISTISSGFLAYFTSILTFPKFLKNMSIGTLNNPEELLLKPYITFKIDPILSVTAALVFSFMIGIGISTLKKEKLKEGFKEFSDLISQVLNKFVIPLLPIYILGIFINISHLGEAFKVLSIFLFVFILIIAMHLFVILIQYTIATIVSKKKFFDIFKNILNPYFTALGTQSSAATIPVTLNSVKNMGIKDKIANFTVPLFATIHLSGSTITLVTCATSIYWIQNGYTFPSFSIMIEFILLLGITMVAAPGVPGGAVMAALGLLASILGFNDIMLSLMIALYVTQDSFGTACNVSGDGALSIIIDTISKED